MTAMTLTARRIGILFLAAAADVGMWTVAGLFGTSEFYSRAIAMGGPVPWNEVLDLQMVTALLWALFTPVVVFIADRLPLRPPHRVRHAVMVVALIPPLAVLRAAVGGAVLNLGEHHPIAASMINLSISVRTHRDMAILAAIFFICNFVDTHREAGQLERQRMHAQTLLARAELDELRMRLQPRFAVRMLRHIATVLRDDPQGADALIVTLSGILRRSMARGGDQERIRLGDELDHLDHCLDLCRAGGRFPVAARYVAGEGVLACRVPALVLQPVIETVVLDLISSPGGGSVEVHCTRDGNETRIEIASTAAAGTTVDAHAESAAVVRARPGHRYGQAAFVDVRASGATVTTTLRVPCDEPAAIDMNEEATA
jgi:hypothetical protein